MRALRFAVNVEPLLYALKDFPSDLNATFARSVYGAHKFVFDATQLPANVIDGAYHHCVELLERNLFQMPFDNVLFQIKQFGRGEIHTNYVLASRGADTIYIRQWHRIGGVLTLNPAVLCMDRDSGGWLVKVINFEPVQMRAIASVTYGHDQEMWLDVASPPIWMMYAAIGLLGAEGVTSAARTPSARLNKDRERKGRLPSHPYSEIVLTPLAQRNVSRCGEGKGPSPITHWRRGHLRTLDDARRVTVRPCIVNADAGEPAKRQYRVKG